VLTRAETGMASLEVPAWLCIGHLAHAAVRSRGGDGVLCLGAAALPLVETRSARCWRLRVAYEADSGCCCAIESRPHVFRVLI